MQSAQHWTSSRRVNRSSQRNGTQLWDRICTASETPADRVSTSLLANSCNSFLVVTSQEQQQIKTTSWLYRRTPITQSSAAGARTLAMSKMGRANQLTGKKIMLLFPVTACKNIKLCPSWSILQTDSKSPCAFPTSRVYRITMALETVLANGAPMIKMPKPLVHEQAFTSGGQVDDPTWDHSQVTITSIHPFSIAASSCSQAGSQGCGVRPPS